MTKKIGAHSRAEALGKLDRRSRESHLLRDVIADLSRHLGGTPSIAQKMLIERAAWLTLHLALMDRHAIEAGQMSERNGREYLAWHNGLVRTLRALGLKAVAEAPPTLAAIMGSGKL